MLIIVKHGKHKSSFHHVSAVGQEGSSSGQH